MENIAHNNECILVVDDDPSVRMLMSTILETLGFKVEEAGNGEQALELLENSIPNMILLDVMMPGLDGFEVCARMKKSSLYSEVPVVLVTGNNDLASIERAYDLGVLDFITKPIPWPLIGYRISFLMRAIRAFSDLKCNEERLTHAHRLAKMGTWRWELDTGKMWFSEEVTQMLQCDLLNFNDSFQAFIRTVHPIDRDRVLSATNQAIESKSSYSIDHQLMLPDGKSFFVHTEASVLTDRNGTPIRMEGAMQDITERKEAEEQIRTLAFFDTLTGLPNRSLFLDNLNRIIIQSRADKNKFAVLFIDIDGFKAINDTLGHMVGDLLLQQLALRLKESVRCDDFATTGIVARLGGDEFVVILDQVRNSEDVAIVAQRIINNISFPVQLDISEVAVTASIGISVFPDDGKNADSLIRHADIAMYSAKDSGKNCFHYFSKSMHEAATIQLEMEKELRMAITRNEFTLNYQPQIDLHTKKVVGFEALIRWNSKQLGTVEPNVFIPLAENNNLICEIDYWVISETCRQIRKWQERGSTSIHIAINLSGRSIMQKGLIAFIRQEIKENLKWGR